MTKVELYDGKSISGISVLCILFVFITSIAHAYPNGFDNADGYQHLRAFLTIFSFFYFCGRIGKMDKHIYFLEAELASYKRNHG